MRFDRLSKEVIGCAIEVHRNLGPGLLESTYEQCLAHELTKSDIGFNLQVPIPVTYKDVKLDCGYRVDLLVEHKIIIEIKAVEALNDIHLTQILTYLKLANCKLGLLINFNVVQLKDGIRRVVNNL